MAAKNSEYRMAIKIAGEMEKSLYNCTDLTRKELNKIAKEAASASSRTKGTFRQGLKETEPFFDGLEKVGKKTFQAVAAAAAAAGTTIIGIGTASAQAGIAFETAFAGVKKTTKATAEEYAQIREEIIGMTREIPATGIEISAVAEAAGQLGIEKENLLAFTRTMVDLGNVANDLSSEDAATALAKFANITGMSPEDYGRLGSTIVELGNNAATTESAIVEMATRLASAGELAGFSEAQIMATATAISSVGIEADAGGSAMSKMIKKVQVAVETGNKSLKDYARVAGMSVSEFKEAFQKDGLSAVAAFISGLNNIERNGKSATVILDEMGLTEVRLSNVLTSLANAGDVFSDAVEMANRAWEENTAITERAAQKYDTTENKIAVMKNSFTEMGIAMYDQFNGPMRDGIDMITGMVQDATADAGNLAKGIAKGVPTAVRMVGQMANAVGSLAGPFLSVGGWLAENPGLLEGTIAGVGSALLSYKVANGISSLVTAFGSLSAASLPVFGLAGVAAVIGGVTVAVKKAAAEAKRASLDAHFGKITLSMQELEDVAAYIIQNNSFGQLEEAISQLGKLEGINDSIDDSISELNRMNWKVSIGMELKEDENSQYQQHIAGYIADMQQYIEQEQYGITLSVGVLTGEELEESNIVTRLNEFYSNKSAELARLGRELNETVTEAFKDGLLDFDESQAIADIQRQMADVKASLAEGSYEASLDLFGLKYSGGELDADSFQNLMAEINSQQVDAQQKYDEAYIASKQASLAMLKDGRITKEQYDADVSELDRGYLKQVGEMDAKAANFVMNTLMKQYGGTRVEDMEAMYGEILATGIEQININGNAVNEWDAGNIANSLGGKLKGADGDALAELWKLALPIYTQAAESAQQYAQSGGDIPAELEEAVKKGGAISVLAGDYENVYHALGVTASKNAEYGDMIEELQERETYIPKQIAAYISENTVSVDEAVQGIWDYTVHQLKDQFGVPIDLEMMLKPKMKMGDLQPLKIQSVPSDAIKIATHADGGFVTSPTISWLAEGGYPESVIPIDGSQNALNLWQKTGEMLGAFDRKSRFQELKENLMESYVSGGSISNSVDNSEENRNFVFSPTIQINGGNTGRGELDEALHMAMEEFESMMKKYIRNKERFSFS